MDLRNDHGEYKWGILGNDRTFWFATLNGPPMHIST